MKASYIIRIDDVCPTMKWGPFARIMETCQHLSIKPILGVVPDNQDPKLNQQPERADFWGYIASCASDGTIIAQHGYQHTYTKYKKTEFTGLPYKKQYTKLKNGKDILTKKLSVTPTWFMAPAHSLDAITYKALKELSFTHITDSIALYPYKKQDLIWVPQQLWRPKSMPFGLWTICLHPNTMSKKEIDELIEFITSHVSQFQNISLEPKESLLNIPMNLLWNSMLSLQRIWHT